jgi:hypothetical protein
MRLSGCFLLLLLVTFCLTASARTLSWLPDPSFQLKGAVPYNNIKVLDTRYNKNSIGFIKTGAFSRYADLVTEDSLHKTLTVYTNQIIKYAEMHQGELLVVLRNLWIEDSKSTEGIGTVHLRADLFLGGNNSYQFLQSVDTLYETGGINITYFVLRNASVAFYDLLLKTSRHTPSPVSTPSYTESQALLRDLTTKRQWPLYTHPPKRGVYHSLSDFLQLQTTDTIFTTKVIKGGGDIPDVTNFYRRNEQSKSKSYISPASCFAIYDGKLWHIASKDAFVPLSREGYDYYAVLPFDGLCADCTSTGTIVGALMFGLPGAVAGSIVDADNQDRTLPYKARLVPEKGLFQPVQRIR